MCICSILCKILSPEKALAVRSFKIRAAASLPTGRLWVRLFNKRRRISWHREAFDTDFASPLCAIDGFDRKGKLYRLLSDYGLGMSGIGPLDMSNVRQIIAKLQFHPQNMPLAALIRPEMRSSTVTGTKVRSSSYTRVFALFYDYADLFVLDLSTGPESASPESVISQAEDVLDTRRTYDGHKPVLIKVRPDFSTVELDEVLHFCLMNGVDGIMTEGENNIRHISEFSKGRFPVIACGGIKSADEAAALLKAGANLVDISSLAIRKGPGRTMSVMKILNNPCQVQDKQ